MNLVGKVPVEPLDDERLTNIERRLVVSVSELREQRAPAPRRLVAIAGVTFAVAAAALVGYQLHRAPVIAPPAPQPLAMRAGALDLGDAQIAGTDFTVQRGAHRVDIVMQPGRLDLQVEHDPGRLYVVRAGGVEIEDVGTRFSVDYDGTHVDVRVSEGAVKVRHAGKAVEIAASEAWGLDIGPVTIAQLDERRAAAAGAALPGPDELVAIAAAPADPGGHHTAASSDGAGPTRSTSSAGIPRGPGSATTPRDAPTGTPRAAATRGKPGTSDPRKALAEAGLTPPIDVGTTDPRQAILEYSKRASAMAEGQDTTRLLYSMAVIQHRANDDRGALRTLVGVTRRVGSNAYGDGLWLEVRIRCLHDFDHDCRRAAERYRNELPSGIRTGIADAVLTAISQQQ